MNGSQWVEQFLNAHNYFLYAVLAALFILIILSWYYIAYFFNSLKRDKILPRGNKKYKYAILIPARNEDKVISNLLDSLKNQSYPKELFDVYIIVESKLDPTVKIAKKYGYNVIIRKDLVGKRTKGYALDEAYQYIKSNNLEYDSFFVIDADNVLSKHYITLMNDCKNQGYKVGMGYRNFTNSNKNWISACSATLFAFMNQYTSKGRSKLFKKMDLTGTGYYVDKDIIDNIGSWIFNGMTEDVELTCYCYYHNIPMNYYPIAQYYDEQPTDFKTVHKQHIRWVWGYFENRKRFKTKSPDYKALDKNKFNTSIFEYNVSIYPLIVMVVLLLIAFLFSFCFFIASLFMMIPYPEFANQLVPLTMFYYCIIYFLLLDIPFVMVSMIVFIISNCYLKFKFKTRLKVYFTFLFFFADFVLAFFDGLFHKYKRTSWDKIPHDGKITSKAALRGLNDSKDKKNKQKVFYYTDEINDDFGNLPLSKKDINKRLDKYKYTRGNSFRRFWCDALYFCFVHPILHVFCFFYGIKKEGKKNLKEYIKKCKEIGKGGFIYGNHVSNFDAFTNQAYVFYKRCNIIGYSNSLANPFLRGIMNVCGYFPLPNSIDQYKRFLNSMKELNAKGEHIIIYPEAHIWPYYTKIRPFVDGSFGYPVKFNVPSIPIITVFKKRKFFKKPRRIILIGKYVMPKEDLKSNENKKYIRDEIYKSMCELASKYDQQEYIKYIKVSEEELNEIKSQK